MKTTQKILLIVGCAVALASCSHDRCVTSTPVSLMDLSPRADRPSQGMPVGVNTIAERNRELTWDTGPAMW